MRQRSGPWRDGYSLGQSGLPHESPVEYVLPLEAWIAKNPANNDPANPPPQGAAVPSVDGHLMNYQAQPNRYGVGNSFYLHIWAWRYNPDGLFSDWNRTVSCAKQSTTQPPVS